MSYENSMANSTSLIRFCTMIVQHYLVWHLWCTFPGFSQERLDAKCFWYGTVHGVMQLTMMCCCNGCKLAELLHTYKIIHPVVLLFRQTAICTLNLENASLIMQEDVLGRGYGGQVQPTLDQRHGNRGHMQGFASAQCQSWGTEGTLKQVSARYTVEDIN